jgi:hypothetical protein
MTGITSQSLVIPSLKLYKIFGLYHSAAQQK